MKTIIEMAREAGLPEIIDNTNKPWAELSIFAELVRADEREACAKVCDEYTGPDYDTVSDILAGSIRARGNT